MSLRVVVVLALLFGVAAPARADAPARSLRVFVQCDGPHRTKACPDFLLGFIDAHKVLSISPRAGADVMLFATSNEVAQIDEIQLRFVGRVAGAPEVVEQTVRLDPRRSDDEQRALLRPAFLRGVALFVAARYPSAVTVELGDPADLTDRAAAGSPWGVGLFIGGSGSSTGQYKSASGSADLVGRWVTPRRRALALAALNGGVTRQPPLMLDDGTIVPLDAHQWSFRGGAEYVHLLSDAWSVGASSYTQLDDPRGQFDYTNRTRAALEWDAFPSDDPRGNRLAAYYHLGWVTERYNIRNEIGERFATYPVHGLAAIGSVRHDRVKLGIDLRLDAQLLHPLRRHNLTGSPFFEVALGDYVALAMSMSITKRALPAPDMAAIDPSDYQLLSRLSYAEPLAISGSLSLSIQLAPTNGVRNNRLESI